MKKILTLLTVVIFLLISNRQILACDYYDEAAEVSFLLIGGKLKYEKGVVCSYDKRYFVSVKNGLAEGVSKVYDESGGLYIIANFKNGKLEGLQKQYYESGALREESNYINGKKEGLEKYYYKSGALWSESNYINGKQEGLYKWYYESGALRGEANYINGKQEGLEIVYLENGRVFAKLYYSNDNLISGTCANGRRWTNAELSNWKRELDVECSVYY